MSYKTHFQRTVAGGLLYALACVGLCAQSTQTGVSFIPWANTGLHIRPEPSGVYAYTAFSVMDGGQSVAFLSTNEPVIVQRSLRAADKANAQSIELPDLGEEISESGGKLYAYSYSKILEIERVTGRVVQTRQVQGLSGEPLVVHQIRKDGERVLILTADECTYWVTPSGRLAKVADRWLLPGNCTARTEKIDGERFRAQWALSGRENERIIQTNKLDLPGQLGTVTPVGHDGKYLCLDIEMAFDEPGKDVRRFLVWIDAKGRLVSRVEVPLHYYTYTRRDLSFDGKDLWLAVSAEAGVHLVKISPKQGIDIPAIQGKRYHYNEHLLRGNEPVGDGQGGVLSPTAGGNCVTRTQVYENGLKYQNLEWTATNANIAATCTTTSGLYYKTPSWVTAGAKVSMPYKWGGFTDYLTFSSLATQGRICGNQATTSSASACLQPPHSSSSDGFIIGVDCSGFVSRCWELGSKYGTTGLPGICSNLGAANSSTGFSALQVGDIINKPSDHVRICLGDNPTGSTNFMEASAVDWRVNSRSYSMTSLTSYSALRFKDITDARLRLNQAITLTPSIVNQGCPLTVTYSVKNFGTEPWSGDVQLVIVQSTGAEVLLQSNSVLLNANLASTVFSFTSQSVSSPLGTSKIEVRLKNGTTCNYARAYKAGNGSYNNPVSFVIGSNCSSGGGGLVNDNCPGAINLPVGTVCNAMAVTNVGATASTPAPSGTCPASSYKDVWFRLNMPNVANPLLTIRTIAGSLTDAVMEVYQGTCGNLSLITCEDDNTNAGANGSTMPVINLSGGPGNQIWVRVWGYNGATGTFSICALNYTAWNFIGGSSGDTGSGTVAVSLSDSLLTVMEREQNLRMPVPRRDVTDRVQVFPNPATDMAILSFEQAEDCSDISVSIYDAAGKLMLKKSLPSSNAGWRNEAVDISTWKAGFYNVQLRLCGETYVEKLMVVRKN